MPLDRDLIDAVKELDEFELRRLHILTAAKLGRPAFDGLPGVRIRQQMVRCGKDSCGSCPHGPYWYAHWREDGKRRSRYLGKLLDEDSA